MLDNFGVFLNLIGLFIKLSVQSFQPPILIYRRGNFVYHHWGLKSIYRLLSYHFDLYYFWFILKVMAGFEVISWLITAYSITALIDSRKNGMWFWQTILRENFLTTPFPFSPLLTHPSSITWKIKIYFHLTLEGFVIINC